MRTAAAIGFNREQKGVNCPQQDKSQDRLKLCVSVIAGTLH